MNKFILLMSVIFLSSSCQETKKVFIGGHLIDCEGLGPQKCMLYKENVTDEWTFFYDTIEGFEYEEGYTYTLEVAITNIKNPPADGSSLQYTLVKLVSKEKNKPIAQYIPLNISEQQKNITKVEYQAMSRGVFMHININKDIIEKSSDRNLKNFNSKKCSKEDWKTIISLLEGVNIEKINELKAPTEKRLFDGAPHAEIKITTQNKTFTSNSFDHGSPPDKIKQLVNTILSLSESIE